MVMMQRREGTDVKEESTTVVIDFGRPPNAGDGRLMTTDITEREMMSLISICDTFFPSINNHHHQSAVVAEFYQTSASMAGTPQRVIGLL